MLKLKSYKKELILCFIIASFINGIRKDDGILIILSFMLIPLAILNLKGK